MTDSVMYQANPAASLNRFSLYAMAVAAGLAVANIYYNQPLLGLIERDFAGQYAAALIPTATQLGFAAGLFLLVPLGDILERRRLILVQFGVLSLVLVAAALAPTAFTLMLASAAIGASATVAQQIVPFAAALSPAEKRGSVIGSVMAGILCGILLSRTLSGFVGAHAGWRLMFALGAPMTLGAGALMAAVLPSHPPVTALPYRSVLASLLALWRRHPTLRRAAMMQACLFGAFTAFWTVLALYLATPAFGLGPDIAGLFGVIGAVGVMAAPLSGRLADRSGPDRVILTGSLLSLGAWLVIGVSGSIIGMIVGVIILDLGVQLVMISNQHVVYSLDPAARSRLNTVFMTSMFLGGASGSALAMLAWTHVGWPGVAALGIGYCVVAVALFLLHRRAGNRG